VQLAHCNRHTGLVGIQYCSWAALEPTGHRATSQEAPEGPLSLLAILGQRTLRNRTSAHGARRVTRRHGAAPPPWRRRRWCCLRPHVSIHCAQNITPADIARAILGPPTTSPWFPCRAPGGPACVGGRSAVFRLLAEFREMRPPSSRWRLQSGGRNETPFLYTVAAVRRRHFPAFGQQKEPCRPAAWPLLYYTKKCLPCMCL
jgi:hypothetical protein